MAQDHPVYRFEPKTPNQQKAVELFKKTRILFLLGPAGSGKSHCAMALAMKQIIDKHAEKIYYTRPLIDAGESMGYLPGEMTEKVAPYMVPMGQVLGRIVYNPPKDIIEPAPLAFLQGWTFNKCVAVMDEAQNATMTQLKLYITRMGQHSKLIICGDPEQSYIRPSSYHNFYTDLDFIVDRLEGCPGIGLVEFSSQDIVRDPLLIQVEQRLRW